MAPQIRELYCTYIWTESFASLLAAPPAAAPMAWLGVKPEYGTHFGQALARRGQADPCVPWLHEQGHAYNHFWLYYMPRLKPSTPPAAAGDMAWRKVAPFRVRPAVKLKAAGLSDAVAVDALIFPHALSVALTLFVKQATDVTALHGLADSLRTRRLTVAAAGAPAGTMRLKDAAEHVLGMLRDMVLGVGAEAGDSGDPFVVATVIDGVDIDRGSPPDPSVYRAAEALCSWTQLPPNFVPRALPQASVRLGGASPSHLLYRLDRGRTVWFPDWFSDEATRSKVKCYHRNLITATAQAEALAALLGLAQPYLASGNNMPYYLDDLARHAAVELGLFYVGDKKSTYRSRSLCAQIVDGGVRDLINLARARYGIGAAFEPANAPC